MVMAQKEIKTQVIYEPSGKAREYNPLACNLYSGCSHGCVYCYAPDATHQDRKRFYSEVKPRVGILEKLQIDADKLRFAWLRPEDPILLCFTCDPYQPIDNRLQITRQAIQILKADGLNVKILTKGGFFAERDFDLLGDGDWFGVTLTCDNAVDSVKWEPIAALPSERIASLRHAHERGLKTWVSLEPVLYPDQVMHLIDMTHDFVDQYKVGVLNYHPRAKEIDWPKFGRDAVAKLESVKATYYLKNDLKKYLS
jgi:DNA repair photolyase